MEVIIAIQKLSKNKATGDDSIPAEFIQSAAVAAISVRDSVPLPEKKFIFSIFELKNASFGASWVLFCS